MAACRPASRHIPQLAPLSPRQLGVLAGHLHRTRPRRTSPGHLAGYGMVHAGTLAATTPTGAPVTLTSGATWHPGYQLHHPTSPRTILITLDTTTIDQLRTPSAQPCAP